MTREEAIKKVRWGLLGLVIDKDVRDAFETLIPELAESEDERIRKELVNFLQSPFIKENLTDEKVAPWIASLEKQKEQNHPNGCFTCDEYKKGYEAGRLNGFTAGYNKAMKEVDQKEQKEIPLMNGDADLYFDEWNQQHSNSTKRECFEAGMLYAVRLLTEDSPMLEEFKKGLEQVILWGREGYKVSPDGTMKSLTQDEIDEVLDEQKEQKPAEWSEEDKQWLSEVYFAIDHSMYSEDERQAMKKYIDFLRSQSKSAEWSEEDERKYQCIRSILLTDTDKKVGSWKYSEILEWYEKRGIGRYTNSQPH